MLVIKDEYLYLVIKDVMKGESEVTESIDKCRKLVALFKHSNHLSEQLKNFQMNNQMDVSTLKQDVVTRWNSTYFMLNSIIKNYSAIRQIIRTYKHGEYIESLLNHQELEICESLFEVLEPFYQLTVKLSASRFPTASLIIPSIEKLSQVLQKNHDLTINTSVKG